MEALRKCRKCGLEAQSKEDLERFAKGKNNKYGRRNLCKECMANRKKQYHRELKRQGLCSRCKEPVDRDGAYCSDCLRWFSNYNRKYHWELRLKAILKLGGVCVVCGTKDLRILTINHREGRNYRTTIDRGDTFYHNILDRKRDTEDLEVRCYNCKTLYEFEMGYRRIPSNLDPILLSRFGKITRQHKLQRIGRGYKVDYLYHK